MFVSWQLKKNKNREVTYWIDSNDKIRGNAKSCRNLQLIGSRYLKLSFSWFLFCLLSKLKS